MQTVTISAPVPVPTGPAITSVSPASGKRGTTITITIGGSGFVSGSQVSITGGGITTTTSYVNANQLNVRVTISSNAFSTLRGVTVVNPNSSSVTKSNAFAVN